MQSSHSFLIVERINIILHKFNQRLIRGGGGGGGWIGWLATPFTSSFIQGSIGDVHHY